MRWREREIKAACGLSGEPSFRLLGDVRGMIVEDQLDRRMSWIGRVEEREEFDELTAAVTILDQGMDFAGDKINPRQQAERAVALIFVIARDGRMHAGHGRQVWR